MEIIRNALADLAPGRASIPLHVERLTLAKRRWRGMAADGREFGFDVEQPLSDGAHVFETPDATYVLCQMPEPVLEAGLREDTGASARLGWLIGNLHFQLETTPGAIRVADDPALRQMFHREGVAYRQENAVFRPLGTSHSHGHHEH